MWGGGVYVSEGATFTLSGGRIDENTVLKGNEYAAGGGIATYNGATVTISGGSVESNISKDIGGGISMGTCRASNESCKGLNKLTMTGGVISANKSNGCGGGIYIANDEGSGYGYAEISAGKITSNKMLGGSKTNTYFGGGGIYVNGSSKEGTNNGELHITNVLITSNTASKSRRTPRYTHSGGGFASCPSSKTTINLNDGAAIYGNTSGYAHDVYIYSATDIGEHSGNPVYQISSVMLGGTPYQWKLESGDYASLSDLNAVQKSNHYELRLHTDITDDSAAKSKAKVIISGNTSSTSGGGIGSNGTVTMGTGSGTETMDLTIKKDWSIQNNLTKPKKIIVAVYRKYAGTDEEPVIFGNQYLRKTDGWSATITNLPAEDENGNAYEYSVKESEIPGYTSVDPNSGLFEASDGSGVKILSEVTGDQEKGFTITNKQVTSVFVQKTWDDNDNQDGKRPTSLTVHLMANGKPQGDPIELAAKDDWKHTWENLDAVDKFGNIIKYSATEDTPKEYKQTSSAVASSNMSVTRVKTSKDGIIDVVISKQWPEGENHPKSLTVELLADGKSIGEGKTAKLSDKDPNKWTAKFEGLPEKNDDGSDIVYTAKVVEVEGYNPDNITFDSVSMTNLSSTVEVGSYTIVKQFNKWQPNNNVCGYVLYDVCAKSTKKCFL